MVQKTTVDWLRFRVQAEPRDALEALRPMFGTVGPDLHLVGLPKGLLGFQRAVAIQFADMPLGRMDFGGDSQRGWVRVDIGGKGCEWVQDWPALESVEQMPKAEVRRLDLALTTWDGEINHDQVVNAHAAGRFATQGRPPSMRRILSSDPRAGQTVEIGVRKKADKFLRAYDKGLQLAAQSPVPITHIDGKRVEDIFRVEVEFKAENRPIPWETVERRDQYFAGAYPFCADVLPGIEADILMRRPDRAPQTDLAAVLANCRIQYGAAIFTALHAYHGDMSAVWDKVCGHRHSDALLEAGVLLVEHH